jgi:hypothetical protein
MQEVEMSEVPEEPGAVDEFPEVEPAAVDFEAFDGFEPAGVAGAHPLDADIPPAVSTGDFRVDSALSRLEELAGVPVAEHVAVFDDVHAQLRAALADLDER